MVLRSFPALVATLMVPLLAAGTVGGSISLADDGAPETFRRLAVDVAGGTAYAVHVDHKTGAVTTEVLGAKEDLEKQAGCLVNDEFAWAALMPNVEACAHTWFRTWVPTRTTLVCSVEASECFIDAINWNPMAYVVIRCVGPAAGSAIWDTTAAQARCVIRTEGVSPSTWRKWDSQIYGVGGTAFGFHDA